MDYRKLTYSQAKEKNNDEGIIAEAHYPIITVTGLNQVKQHELVICESGEIGEVFELSEDRAQVALFSNDHPVIGTQVARLETQLTINIHEGFFNTVHNPIGELLLGKDIKPNSIFERNIFTTKNSLKNFRSIKQQFLTGVNVIDMVIPIGKGQRQLLIGDRKTGKRALSIQAAASAVAQNIYVIYTLIGQNATDIQSTYHELVAANASSNTAVIATTAADSPMLIYLTPYTAMAVAESIQERGHDVLIIFDDLSTHASVYRELSLIAGRLPGRESYPGDIFYIHANLLERAGNFITSDGKEASITALPFIHTNDSDIASYIATNSIGMTDGHLFFDKELFLNGIRPPVHMGLSVTRAGKQTQTPLLRDINSSVATFYSQYERVQNFARFGGEISDTLKDTLFQGELLNKFFTWVNSAPLNLSVEITLFALIWAGYFKKENVNAMYTARNNLNYIYSQSDGKAFIDTLCQASSLNIIIEEIKKVEESLLKICGLRK